MPKRTIELSVDLERLPDTKEAFMAIGYLSTWGIVFYNKVHIYEAGDDMMAHYEAEGTDKKYTIGAVWDKNERKYSFHS